MLEKDNRQQSCEIKNINKEIGFYVDAGTTLSTWGLGTVVLAVRIGAPKQFLALPILLIPIVLITFITAVNSKNLHKRQDASHISFLATASTLSAISNISSTIYYMLLITLLLIVAWVNRRNLIMIAPVGHGALFVAFLSPYNAPQFVILLFSMTLLLLTLYFCKNEKNVAISVFPLLASLFVLHHRTAGPSILLALLAVSHILSVFILRAMRVTNNLVHTERRLTLDNIIILISLSLFIESVTSTSVTIRYLIIAIIFLVQSGFYWVFIRIQNRKPFVFENGNLSKLLKRAILFEPEILLQTTFAIFFLSLLLSLNALIIPIEPLFSLCIKISLLIVGTSILYAVGRHFDSAVQRDIAKLSFLYIVFLSFFAGIKSEHFKLSNLYMMLAISFLLYVSVAFATWSSVNDLPLRCHGAWQGIFSGRALVRIRQTRIRIMEVLGQAPIIGWMFHMIDKVISNLQESFSGSNKVWTIAHYTICIAIAIGLFASMDIIIELATHRLPQYGINIFKTDSTGLGNIFHISICKLSAIILYSSAIFFIGSIRRLQYLRYLASVLAGFAIISQWFFGLGSKENPTSSWYFPLAFFCFMALTRVLSPDKISKEITSLKRLKSN